MQLLFDEQSLKPAHDFSTSQLTDELLINHQTRQHYNMAARPTIEHKKRGSVEIAPFIKPSRTAWLLLFWSMKFLFVKQIDKQYLNYLTQIIDNEKTLCLI